MKGRMECTNGPHVSTAAGGLIVDPYLRETGVVMSSRLYPRYVYGNPQLRIFLPDFWMILVKPKMPNAPKNLVNFRVHVRMTENDVRNYMEKVYKLPVASIRSRLVSGKMPMGRTGQYLVKEYDYRLCDVYLPVGMTFTHPGDDLFLVDGKAPDLTEVEQMSKKIDEVKSKFQVATSKSGRHLPAWWSTSTK